MRVYQGLEQFEQLPCAVVTTGTFDGVHIGHQQILARLREVAQRLGGETVVITFFPHPRMVVGNTSDALKQLSTIEEKTELLRVAGIDHFIILPFTPQFSQISPEEYVQQVYVHAIGTKYLIIGYDHRFGRERGGDLTLLQRLAPSMGFVVEEIPRQDVEAVGVSSTRIRHALHEGNAQLAGQYLGRPYSFGGRVRQGDQIGRTIGFPTANLSQIPDYKLIPAAGIYAVRVEWRERYYKGMLYIGTRPTIVEAGEQRIEVHLLDFSGNLYGEYLTVLLIDKIRDDASFDTIEAMRLQLMQDEQQVRARLGGGEEID